MRQGYLDNLTPDEKTYLAPYVLEEVTSQVFELEDGIAGGLVAKNIIYRSSNLGNVLEGFPYNMQPWARDYLHQHLELLQGAAARPNQRDRHW